MNKDIDFVRMTRSRLYVLIDAFERDMRKIIRRYITTELPIAEALGSLYPKAENRMALDEASTEETDAVEYLDLMEAYEILNRHRRLLPEELATEVRQNTVDMPRLVAVRKRVMHSRPLLSDDALTVTALLTEFRTQWWPQLQRTSAQVRADDEWEPALTFEADPSLTLHNLPAPDYDETGLLGRDQEAVEVVDLLKRKREPVITITGEGGIGKTALALFAAYRLVDAPTRPFDAILWVSLKHEKLTAAGVQVITGAVKDIYQSAPVIGRGLDSSFIGALSELAEALSGFDTLIVLDNLETISGDEFGVMYDTLPDSVRYLVTSRVGLGQYERRYPLSELKESAAVRLLNEHITFRRVTALSRISGDTRRTIVQKLRKSPLGIIWFVLAVEAGRDAVSLLKEQGELLEFCVRSVYDGLTPQARVLLDSLAVVGRPAGPDELMVFTGEDLDVVNLGVQELERGSLVRREDRSTGSDLRMVIRLTETASTFLEKRVTIDRDLTNRISTRERELGLNEERRLSDVAKRSLDPVVIHARGPQDTACAYLLRQSLLHGREGDLGRATELLAQARRLSSDFWEVDRVEAFLRIYGDDFAGASNSYESALSLAEGVDRGIVAYFYSNHMSKHLRDPHRALELATLAHDLVKTDETAVGLGNMLIRGNQFQGGLDLLRPIASAASGRLRVIALDAYANGLRRWGEWSGREERNPLVQFHKAAQGARVSLDAMEAGLVDDKLRNTACRCSVVALEGAAASVNKALIPKGLDAWLAYLSSSLIRLTGTPDWAGLGRASLQLAAARPPVSGARRLSAHMTELEGAPSGTAQAPAGRLHGELVSKQPAYGFIRHPSYPGNLFFHQDDCESPEVWKALEVGQIATFDVTIDGRGPRAAQVARH